MNFLRSIKYGIRNLFLWFMVIWKDRDWDHYYLYKILEFKLKRMENLFRYHGHHIGDEKTANKMKICRLLLKRLADDEYYSNALMWHEKKWGELDTYIDDDGLHFTRANAITEEEKAQEAKESHFLSKHAFKMPEQDLDLLFKIMRKNIQRWWD